VVIFSVYSGLTILLKLSKSFFRVKKIEFEKSALELTTIRNQLNPHFLFNGLNSIYSLSLDKDERTSEAILQLSDILRFVLYEINEKTIPVSKEIEMIEKYIEIQLLRLDNPGLVTFNNKGSFQHGIVPMLFFPLVENAFKHGNLHHKNSKIEIEIDSQESFISFKCMNSFDELDSNSQSGIGIKSVRKSLEHHYGRKASFEINKGEQTFKTSISINF
jgi:sensor histidine kinase YesM